MQLDLSWSIPNMPENRLLIHRTRCQAKGISRWVATLKPNQSYDGLCLGVDARATFEHVGSRVWLPVPGDP
jgi:hypothetical protein